MSTNTALGEIKARIEGHTEGPWRVWKHGSGPRDSGVETTWAYEGDEPKQITDWCFPADAELIAAAPKLLAALEAVEAMHVPDAETGKCEECTYARYSMFSVSYPCPTIKAITDALA